MSDIDPTDEPEDPGLKVVTPSGQSFEVLGPEEREFYVGQAAKYLEENHFSNTSDLLDLDRLLFLEMMVYRATNWIGSGRNYEGEILLPSEETGLRRTLKENSAIISTIKNDLGLTKAQRDKAQYESVGTYIRKLRERAQEFGYHREKQLQTGIRLNKQLFSIVDAFDRSDPTEREKIGFRDEKEILDWIRDVMRPEFNAVDAHFIQNAQRTWVRDL